MKAREFLEVAEDLLTELREGAWRSAVSRAYYAVFHTASLLLQQRGFVVPQGDRAHGHLWLRISNCGYAPLEKVGRDLSYLRTVRNTADYDLNYSLGQATASRHVQLASDSIDLLEQAAGMPTVLTQITDAMRNYERDVLKEVTWQP